MDLSVSAGGKIFMKITRSNECCNSNLWVSDGSARGLRKVVEDPAHPEDVIVYDMQVLGNSLLLNATTTTHGAEIARLDIATEALTFLEAPVDPSSSIRGGNLVVINGVAYYTGLDATNPNSTYLWRTDGTLAGTRRVVDLNPGQMSVVRADTLTKVGDRVVFIAEQFYQDPELWGSDGTAAGTQKLTTSLALPQIMGVSGSRAYFFASLDPAPAALKFLSTDGTPAGTRVIEGLGAFSYIDQYPLSIIGDDTATFFSGPAYDASRNVNVLGLFRYDTQTSRATFLATQDEVVAAKQPAGVHRRARLLQGPRRGDRLRALVERWHRRGTGLLKNIAQEVLTSSSTPDWLTEFNGKLYFVADDGVHGREIWMSDGTGSGHPAGVRRVAGRGLGRSETALRMEWLAVLHRKICRRPGRADADHRHGWTAATVGAHLSWRRHGLATWTSMTPIARGRTRLRSMGSSTSLPPTIREWSCGARTERRRAPRGLRTLFPTQRGQYRALSPSTRTAFTSP